MNPFEVISAVTNTKKDLLADEVSEKAYPAFMVNRGLSYYVDCLARAQEMNVNPHLDGRLQFDYLINTIRKGKRFSKWSKPQRNDDFSLVQEYYGYNVRDTETALRILTRDQLDAIKERIEKGGIK